MRKKCCSHELLIVANLIVIREVLNLGRFELNIVHIKTDSTHFLDKEIEASNKMFPFKKTCSKRAKNDLKSAQSLNYWNNGKSLNKENLQFYKMNTKILGRNN